jgi:hypothetical protein
MQRNRREFLENVGSGMLIAGLGSSLAGDLGVSSAFAEFSEKGAESLEFGKLQPLVGLLQETPAEKIQPILVKKLKDGSTDLRQLIAAAALANAETFGGEDYVGFHTEMALLPALQMSRELPKDRQPLPVLKVLHRNTKRIQESGFLKNKVLKPIARSTAAKSVGGGESLRKATRAGDMQAAENLFAAQMQSGSLKEAYNRLLWSVQDNANVHRFVLAHRAFGLIDVVGPEHAHTMLRQCVRFCVKSEDNRIKRKQPEPPHRRLIPRLLDQYKLLSRKPGKRQPGDQWLEEMSMLIHRSDKDKVLDAVAAALGEGIAPEVVGQAISLGANQLVLRQGVRKDGSHRCHGDSPGVHSSDSTNAWRNMARVSDHRNATVGLMIGAYHVAQFQNHTETEPFPLESHLETIKTTDAGELLETAARAIRKNDQGQAAAAIAVYGQQGHAVRPVLDLMLRFGCSEDGRLHAEKYYHTVGEEYRTTSKTFRWRQIVGLARVTASSYGYNRKDEHGHRAPGYEQACSLLGVEA